MVFLGAYGKLDLESINKLANSPNAQFLYDKSSNYINVIQDVNGKLLRITALPDTFKIISVGPIQERNVINSISNGRFIPIKTPEIVEVNSQLMEAQP